jgi:hypothetical protein
MKKLFYFFKPLIPRIVQIFLRRVLVGKQLKKHKIDWPILRSSAKKPNGWIGWPEDKKFAIILTHDVEHQKGYNRVLELMNLEKELGFVSSFYFVPERDYKVEIDLLNKLKDNGFEYGVHGLYHDGKLFSSEKEFSKRAIKINKYIKEWEAVGFRAPAMHHNLELIGRLNIKYDLSTFDSDPFEPQPDGVDTIFPFWVDGKNENKGYVELPYTLTQDFTLFIIMKEESPEVWIKKLDWIVENGGMALLNIHPDYINFNNKSKLEEFPVKYFVDFLKYVKSKYSGQFWNALPRDAANYFMKSKNN